MQPNAYSRPDDRELLRASLRLLSGRFRPAVLFAGLASGERLQLTDFLGTATSSLHQVVVVPGAGLGGRVFTQRRPFLVEDYIASEGITHEYDLAVRRERLTSMAAVPVVVQGTVAGGAVHREPGQCAAGGNRCVRGDGGGRRDRRRTARPGRGGPPGVDHRHGTGRARPDPGPELAGARPGSPRRAAVPGRHGVRSCTWHGSWTSSAAIWRRRPPTASTRRPGWPAVSSTCWRRWRSAVRTRKPRSASG